MLWLPFVVLGLAALARAWRPEWGARRWPWLAVGLASFTALAARHLASPWVRHHDFNAAVFVLAARAHLRFGWLVTRGVDVWNGGTGVPVELHRYMNHPPLVEWLLALPMSMLGVHEWVARATVLALLLAALVALCLRWEPAAEAGPFLWLFAAAMPAFSFYGRMPGHEPLTIAMLLALVVLTQREPTRGVLDGIVAVGVFLPLASWAGCVFAGAGVVYLWAVRNRRAAGALAAGATVGCALLALFMWLAYGGEFRPLVEQFLRRSSGTVADGGEAITSVWAWAARVARHGNEVVGWPMAALALAGVAFAARGGTGTRALVAWLAGGGLLLIGVLRQWSYVHDFSTSYLGLAALLAAAPLAGRLLRLRSRTGRLAATAVVAATLALHALPPLEARDKPILSARYEVKLGARLQQLTAPTDLVAFALRPPSPMFLYYADRDFLIWPNPLFGRTGRIKPKAFIQVHGAPPEDSRFRKWLAAYDPAPGVRGVWLRRER